MVNKTNYLSGLVSESLRSLQIMDPDTEFDEDGIPERSLYSAAKFVVSKLISDNEKKEYENLINQIILNLYDYLVSNKDDLSVFFDDKDSMNNWKNLNVILNLMVKSNAVFMYERIGLKKREEIFSMLPGEDYETHASNIYGRIIELLSEIASSKQSTNLRELIMNVLYLQTIVKRAPDLRKLPDEIVEEFPVLQQTGLYKLEPVSKFPEYFAPRFKSSNEGLGSLET